MNGRADELGSAVRQALGASRRVRRVRRRPHPYQTSFPLEQVEVAFADGSEVTMLVKDLSWSSLDPAVRRAKPEFLHEPCREIEVYAKLLDSELDGTARYYGSASDAGADRHWLLIERVAGRELFQIGELALWRAVAAWAAGFHSRHHGDEARLAARAPLVRHDAAHCRRWAERARRFAGGAARDAEARERFEWAVSRYEDGLERLLGLPTSLVHGELYPSNVIVGERAGRTRVCPVDWEVAAIAPCLVDLAALTTGSWSAAQRRELEAAYRAAARGALAAGLRGDSFAAGLCLCRLHLAIQWLGWASAWQPPEEHRHDWLGEAVRAAEELDG